MKKFLFQKRSAQLSHNLSLKMKLSVLFTFTALLSMQANESYAQRTKITLNLENVSFARLLDEIESKTDFRFVYQTREVNLTRKISVKGEKEKVTSILDRIFQNTAITYKIIDKQIFLRKSTNLKSSNSNYQSSIGILQNLQFQINGTITDENGAPLAGANIVEKGTTNGVTADFDGNFSMEVADEHAVLVVTYIGFATLEVAIDGRATINVILKESAAGLDEVVLVGYGTQTKATLTGSIVTLDSKKLEETPVANLSNAIAGQLPGVIVNTRSGAPGDDEANILIRGKGTLGNTQPLIVIDGIPDRGGFSRMNPEDIESFSVLKDASAAIYGARAANGVILITTKRGNSGKPQFSFNTSVGWSQPTRLPNLLDSWQYATVENEYTDNFSGAPHKWSDEDIQKFKDGSDPLTHPNTDWLDYIIKDWTMQTNNSFTVRGGSEAVKYYVSSQYLDQKGGFKNGDFPYSQFQLRANLDIQLTKTFSLGLDLSNRKENREAPAAGSYGDIMHTASATYPYLVPYYPNGLPGKGFQASEPNLAVSTSERGGYNKRTDNIYNTKVSFSWDLPLVGLNLNGYGAYDTQFYHRKQFKDTWDEYTYDETTGDYDLVPSGNVRSLGINKNDWNTTTYHLQLDYKRSFGEHNIDAFVAYEQSKFVGTYLYAYREGFPSNQLQDLFAGDVNKALTNNSSSTAFGRMNYFGRVNYDFAGKYLASFTLRYDGSQNFPKGERFGAFPGISVGWRLSEESFLKDNEIVNNLKLRASVGKMGNDAVAPYQYLASYEYSDYDAYGWGVQTGYAFGDNVKYVPGFVESTVPNPYITWEKATTTNLGFDSNLFDNKLGVVFDVFHSIRKDILIARSESVPDYTGLKLPDENLGEVLNNGFEIDVSYRDRITDDLSYSISGNFSLAKNKVKYLDEATDIPEYQKKEGYPIDSYVVYDADGLFQTQEEVDNYPHLNGTGPGDVKLIDTNNDGEIDEKDQIRRNYGITPEMIYGLNLGLSYKNFDLTVFFQGQGNAYLNIIPSLNYDQDFFDGRWQKEGDNDYPRVFRDLNSGSGPSNRTSTYWLKPADFLRLKNVYLSYNLPQDWMSHVFLSNAKIYLQASNLFSIDQIKYFDPESSSSNGLESYPIQRTVQIGLDLKF